MRNAREIAPRVGCDYRNHGYSHRFYHPLSLLDTAPAICLRPPPGGQLHSGLLPYSSCVRPNELATETPCKTPHEEVEMPTNSAIQGTHWCVPSTLSAVRRTSGTLPMSPRLATAT